MILSRRHFIAGALASTGASAGEILRVGVPEFGPWAVETDGGVSGVVPRIFDPLLRGLGMTAFYVREPIQRQYADLRQGKLDLALLANPQEDGGLQDFGSFLSLPLVLVTAVGKPYTKAADLEGKVIASLRNGSRAQKYLGMVKGEEVRVADIPAGIHMLLDGRADALLALKATFLWNLKQMGLPREAVGNFIQLGNMESAVAARPGLWHDDPATCNKFKAALVALRDSGATEQIFALYGGGMN